MTEQLPWILTMRARLPRLAWWLQVIGNRREHSWRVIERALDARLAEHPELVAVGPRLRSTHRHSWWWLRMEVEQQLEGPYVVELAEHIEG